MRIAADERGHDTHASPERRVERAVGVIAYDREPALPAARRGVRRGAYSDDLAVCLLKDCGEPSAAARNRKRREDDPRACAELGVEMAIAVVAHDQERVTPQGARCQQLPVCLLRQGLGGAAGREYGPGPGPKARVDAAVRFVADERQPASTHATGSTRCNQLPVRLLHQSVGV